MIQSVENREVPVFRPGLPDADLRFCAGWLPREDADRHFLALREQVAWRQEDILLFGRRYRQPRLLAWYGDSEAVYSYSGNRMQPQEWIAPLSELKASIEAITGVRFNSVLLNRYRDERDAMGWHSDDEPELGRDPLIASLSLGATREFQLRHRLRREMPVERIALAHGSLLIMAGPTQHYWKHRIRRESRTLDERINLTFRCINPLSRKA